MKKIALSVLTSCLMIGTINTAYSAKEKMNVDLSYLDGVSKAQHYEDSVDIVNGGKRTIDCSNVVKREETRNGSCAGNYVGSTIEKRRVYGSGKIQVAVGQPLTCENTTDGRMSEWETVSSNCRYLPICHYNKEVIENGSCKNGNTISTYRITSVYNGQRATATDCATHTTKTLIATESCNTSGNGGGGDGENGGNTPEKNIIDKTPKPHFTPTNNPDNANITSEFDDKGRLRSLRIRDNRTLRDGIYYKEIALNLSQESINQLASAKIALANFDDWLEVKINGQSVFSGPFEDDRYILLCKSGRPVIENTEGTSDLLTISDARLRNYLDERSLNYFKQGELDYRSRYSFKNNYLVAKNNSCAEDTGKHAEQNTDWYYRDGKRYDTRFNKDGGVPWRNGENVSAFYYYNKDFSRININDLAPNYNAKNFADKLVAGKNRLITQMIVSDEGRLDYTIKFEYKDSK